MKIPFGIKGSPYQNSKARCKDKRRLARKRGDTPPPSSRRIDNPRIREDPALMEFCSNTDKIHQATSEDPYAQAWVNYSQSIFPQSVKKTGGNVEQFHIQHISAVFSSTTWAHLIRRVNSENHRIWVIWLANINGTMSPICHFFASFGEITMHMWFWQLSPTVDQQMQDNYWKIMACWDASQPGAIICQPMPELTQQVTFGSCGNRILEKTKVHIQQSLRWSLAEGRKDQTKSRVSEPRTHFPVTWTILPRFLNKTIQQATWNPQQIV